MYYSKSSTYLKYSKAFTLAEVLIIFGVVGTVALLTVPPLLGNIYDMQFKQGAKVAFSKCSQAILQIEADQGETLDYYLKTGSTFKPVFMRYFKVAKDCGNNDGCVPASDASNIYKTLAGYKAQTNWISSGQFTTIDGMFFGILNNGSYIFITVDVNGYKEPPNAYGKDVYMFELLGNVLEPSGANNTYTAASGNLCDKSSSDWSQGLSCMYKVLQGINY